MIETFSLEAMKKAMGELAVERMLAYYGILTNCRGSDGEYRKEVLLFKRGVKSDGFEGFCKVLDSHDGIRLEGKVEIS